MIAYLYFAIACAIGCIFCGGMALGMWITERQYKKEKENNDNF